MLFCGNKKVLLATPVLVIMNCLVSGLKFVSPLFCFPCFRTGKHNIKYQSILVKIYKYVNKHML